MSPRGQRDRSDRRGQRAFDMVAIVRDGSALLTAAAALEPDVIVTDIGMPSLDGLEATAAIVQRPPTARVALVTVHDEAGVQRRGLAAGALGFVGKFRAHDDLCLWCARLFGICSTSTTPPPCASWSPWSAADGRSNNSTAN
jgi:DNA-binding NarL/FixJ family response regulator